MDATDNTISTWKRHSLPEVLAIMAFLPLQCTRCHESFLSNQELQRHHDQRECHGTAGGTFANLDQNSDSEWEYEYSATENESFYLTLDLPVPRSGANVEEGPKGGRLTKRKDRWLNSTHLPFIDESRRNLYGDDSDEGEIENGKRSKVASHVPSGKRASTHVASKMLKKAHRIANDEDAEGETEDEVSSMNENGRRMSKNVVQGSEENRLHVSQKEATVDAASQSTYPKDIPHEIQILELHNKNPIIIYRTQQFRCSWAENLGTELLFIKHSDISAKPEGCLPIVKELPDEVDLLAVSGVRVIGKPINLRPKPRITEKGKAKAQISTRNQPVRIPIGILARADRKAQARFLEMLQDIKVKRGEDDEVTVNALPRKENRARKDRAKERKRQLRFMNAKRASKQQIAAAKAKIAELDALDAAGDGVRRRRRQKPTQAIQQRRDELDEGLVLESLGLADGTNSVLRPADEKPLDGQSESNTSQEEDDEEDNDDSESGSSSDDDSESSDMVHDGNSHPEDDGGRSDGDGDGDEQDIDPGQDDDQEMYDYGYESCEMDDDGSGREYSVEPYSRDIDVGMDENP